MQTVPRRRWFQVSLAEWLILTTLLGVAWWQCTRWPVPDTESREVVEDSSGDMFFEIRQFDIQRQPTPQEVAIRGAITTATIIGVWLVGSIAVCSVIGRR